MFVSTKRTECQVERLPFFVSPPPLPHPPTHPPTYPMMYFSVLHYNRVDEARVCCTRVHAQTNNVSGNNNNNNNNNK